MKTNLTAQMFAELIRMKPNRMDDLLERLYESDEFAALIKGYAGLTLPDMDHDGKIQGRDAFLADLTAEIQFQSEALDADTEESNRIERSGAV